MSLDRLNEAFKLLDALNEDMFDTSLDGINSLADAMDGDNSDDIIKIIDVDAETEEDVQDSYLGKVILNCNVCHSLRFANKDEIEIDDSGIVNGEEACPYCGESEGFTIIGQIEEFGEGEASEETSETDEDNLDDNASEITEPNEDKENETEFKESFKRHIGRKLNESGRSVDFARIKKLGKKLIKESAEDVTDQVELDAKEQGVLTKKKELEKQGYKTISTANGKITMAKAKELTESSLPKSVKIKASDLAADSDDEEVIFDAVSDYLSDRYGYCHKGFNADIERNEIGEPSIISVSNIEWDLDENNLTESPYYLDTKFDSRKSFYNKAMVSDNTDDLYSYGVHVMSIENGRPVIKCREDQLSQTTLRHIKEFLKQKGFPAISKQQIIKDYMVECMTEDLSTSPYNSIIVRYFDYTGSDRFFDVIADLVDRVEDFSNEEEIWEAIDSGLIYTRDQWEVYMHYCDMGDSTDKMYESLFGDIFAICDTISNSKEPTVMAESVKSYMKTRLGKRFVEGFNNINVETDDQKLTMSQDEAGKVTVTTEPLTAIAEGSDLGVDATATEGDETISPVSDDLANELIGSSEEEMEDTTDSEEEVPPEEGTTEEGDELPTEEEELPAEGDEESGDEFEESFNRGNTDVKTPEDKEKPIEKAMEKTMDESIGDWYRKTFDRPASITAQQCWEAELNGECGEISDKRRDALKKKFERQRDWERRHGYGVYAQKPEVDMEIKDFDEVSFSTLGEKYLKSVYENVSSFKATDVSNNDRTLIVEGVISFDSGVQKKTGFIFEADSATKDGSVRFVGGNKHFSNSNKAFVLTGKLHENKLFTESFSYNYRPTNSKNRIVGKVHSK